MSNTLRFAYILVAVVIILAVLWIAFTIGHLLPNGWFGKWYGLPMAMTLLFGGLLGMSPAFVLINCLIDNKPLTPKPRTKEDKEP